MALENFAGESGARLSAVRVKRFDRVAGLRQMCLSGATLAQTASPGPEPGIGAGSYRQIAEALVQLRAPSADLVELYDRMIFNCLCGNDDDHLRNHAAVFDASRGNWRLSPGFDVVPSPDGFPGRSQLQIARNVRVYSRQAVLQEGRIYGFASPVDAGVHLDAFLERATEAWQQVAPEVEEPIRAHLAGMLGRGLAVLR